jgi:hypothetical protein
MNFVVTRRVWGSMVRYFVTRRRGMVRRLGMVRDLIS